MFPFFRNHTKLIYYYSCFSDEIDDDLLIFLDGLVVKEMTKLMGPSAKVEDEKHLPPGPGKSTVDILRMIQRRLEFERKVENKSMVTLLGKLLAETGGLEVIE